MIAMLIRLFKYGSPRLVENEEFVDVVSGEIVYTWTDDSGDEWMANSKYSFFRVFTTGKG